MSRFGVQQRVSEVMQYIWFNYLPKSAIMQAQFLPNLLRRNAMQQQLRKTAKADRLQRARKALVHHKRQRLHTRAGASNVDETADYYIQDNEDDSQGVSDSASGSSNSRTSSSSSDSAVEDGDQLESAKLNNVLTQGLLEAMHPQISVVISYAACVYLREAVLPGDLINWALSGQLPYLDMARRCSHLLDVEHPKLPPDVLRTSLRLTPLALMHLAQGLADSVHLRLPPVNAEALLLRAIKDIDVPKVSRLSCCCTDCAAFAYHRPAAHCTRLRHRHFISFNTRKYKHAYNQTPSRRDKKHR